MNFTEIINLLVDMGGDIEGSAKSENTLQYTLSSIHRAPNAVHCTAVHRTVNTLTVQCTGLKIVFKHYSTHYTV